MVSLRQLSTFAAATGGLAAMHANACPNTDSAPRGPEASEKSNYVASFATPAGIALVGTAGVMTLSRARTGSNQKGSKFVGSAEELYKAAAASDVTGAFDYPGGDEW